MLVKPSKKNTCSSNQEKLTISKLTASRNTYERKINQSRRMVTYAQSARMALAAKPSISRRVTQSTSLFNSKPYLTSEDFPSLSRTFSCGNKIMTNPVNRPYQIITDNSPPIRNINMSYLKPTIPSVHNNESIDKPFRQNKLSISSSSKPYLNALEPSSFNDIFRIEVARSTSYKYTLSLSSTMAGSIKKSTPNLLSSSIQPCQIQIKSVKTILGPVKYKRLREITKEFSSNNICAEVYIKDIRQILIGESKYYLWTFMSDLIKSLPNVTVEKKKALRIFEDWMENKNKLL